MNVVLTVVLALQMMAALGMIGRILLQHGKGADMGAAFGGGASGSLFGATGSANFLSRTTAVLATLFFLSSLGLAYLATSRPKEGGGTIMDRDRPKQEQPAKPAATPEAPKPPAAQPGKEVPQ